VAASDQYAVGTVPALLASAPAIAYPGPAGWFYITVGTATSVYLGGSVVTTSNGAQAGAGSTLTGYLFSGDQVYAVTAAGTVTVGVLQTGA
jgi:hypothetical protein